MGSGITSNHLAILCFLILTGWARPTDAAGDHPLTDMEKGLAAIQRIFPQSDTTERINLSLSPTERSECGYAEPGESLAVIISKYKARVLGYAVIDNVLGKDLPITYLLAVTPDLAIQDLEIITYREPYGGEVGFESWQKQFYGKTPESNLRHGREIRNISGATISARSVTIGVRRTLCILKALRQRLPH